MKNNIKKIFAFLLAGAMLLGCTACGKSKKDDTENVILESSGGKELVRSAAADEVFSLNSNSRYSLNPLIATNHSNQLVCSLVYENMVELDNNFEVIKNVIVDWDKSDDGKYWTLTLDEEGAHTFHDGTPVASKDVRYSLERAISADRYRGRFSSVWGVSHDEGHVYVSLGVGDTQFVKLLNIPIIKSGSFNDKRPMGSGPYTYNEEGTELHAWEKYKSYDTLPVDTVYLKEYETADSVISAFEDSLIDVVINDPSSYTNLGYASTNETHTFATTHMHYVAFNEESPLGKYAQFRVAMQHAFDRAYLVDLLGGNAVASPLPMYPTCADYPQGIADSLRFDLEVCQRILEAAGIKDYDEDGKLEYMSGSPQKINLNFVVCSDSSAKADVVKRFQEDMKSIGLTITVQELTWDNYIKALEEGKFDMYYGEVKLRNNFDLTELLQVRDEDNEATNLNYTNSKDKNYASLINDYLAAGDAGREFAYQSLCDYIFKVNGSLVVLGFEKQQIITHRGVIKGLDANIGNPLYNIENWTITLTE